MAANNRNDLNGSGILQEWLQRKFLKNFDPNLVFAQFAESPDTPEGYNTLRWAKFTTIAEGSVTTGTTSNDGVTPSDTSIAVTSTTATPTQYRIVTNLSDMLLGTNPLPLLTKTAERVGVVMAKVLDTVVQSAINGGTYVYYGGSASARTGLGATDVLTTTLLLKASQKLRSLDAPEIGGYYIGVVHPLAEYDLKASTSTSVQTWFDAHKYAKPDEIFNGEIGSFGGVRLIRSSHVNTFTSTTTVYPTYVFGAQAFGLGYWQRPQVFVTDMVPSDSDPAAQRRRVSGKMAVAAVLLQDTALVRIETGATAL